VRSFISFTLLPASSAFTTTVSLDAVAGAFVLPGEIVCALLQFRTGEKNFFESFQNPSLIPSLLLLIFCNMENKCKVNLLLKV
jgi:Flp pilus assembly protein CpaB